MDEQGRERLAWGGGALILYGLGQWSVSAACVFSGCCCWAFLYWTVRGQPEVDK